jgi:aromatic ring hydroxylase
MGVDAINAVNAASFEADKQNNGSTEYHKNFLKWLEYFQKNDLVGSCAQTDVKGERLKRPIEQADPDMYLHVVERKKDGIVVKGCKVHISEASIADEIMVVPTRALGPDEKDYAVAFAVPADHEGVKQIVHIHSLRDRKHFKRGFDFAYSDSYVVFDNVFVPWSAYFFAARICTAVPAPSFLRCSIVTVTRAANPRSGDVLLGLASQAANINGIRKAPHVKEMLSEIIRVSELGYAAGFTASSMGKPEIYVPGMGPMPYGPAVASRIRYMPMSAGAYRRSSFS